VPARVKLEYISCSIEKFANEQGLADPRAARDALKERLEKTRARVLEELPAGEDALERVARDERLDHGVVGPVRALGLVEVEAVKVFSVIPDAEELLQPRELSRVRAGDRVVCFYRVLEREPERQRPLAEVREEVVRSLVEGADEDVRFHYARKANRFRDAKTGSIPPLDAVKDEVRRDYLLDLGWERASAAARAASLRVGLDLDAIARDHGLEVRETGAFGRDAKLADVAPDLARVAPDDLIGRAFDEPWSFPLNAWSAELRIACVIQLMRE
jgi:hypothetical protein